MFIELTNQHGERISVNPDHIIRIEQLNGDNPHAKLITVREDVHVRETREQIHRLVNGTPTAPALETKQDAAFVQPIADSPAAVVAEALAAEVPAFKRKLERK